MTISSVIRATETFSHRRRCPTTSYSTSAWPDSQRNALFPSATTTIRRRSATKQQKRTGASATAAARGGASWRCSRRGGTPSEKVENRIDEHHLVDDAVPEPLPKYDFSLRIFGHIFWFIVDTSGSVPLLSEAG